MRHVPGMTPDLALASHALMLRDDGGFSHDGRIDRGGVARVLRLRSRYVPGHQMLHEASAYSDMHYWQLAFGENDAVSRF